MSVGLEVLGAILVVAGILLIVVEVVHPGAFLMVPAAILVASGLFLVFVPGFFLANPVMAALLLIGVAFLGAALAIPLYRKIAPTHAPIPTTVQSMWNAPAKVLVPIEPGNMRGKIRVRGEIWSATADQPIPEGREVIVVGGEGVVLRVAEVAPASGGSGAASRDGPVRST